MSGPVKLQLVLGRGGKGKSFLARHLVRKAARLILFDPNGEAEHAAKAEVLERPDQLVNVLRYERRFRICWRGYASMGRDAFEFANRCALAAGNVTLLWDEIDRFQSPHRLPEYADVIVNAGRHKGVSVVACSRRPPQVHGDLRANASRLIVFRTVEPDDVKYLRHRIEDRAAVEALRQLGDHEAVVWTDAGWSVQKSPFD